MNRSSLKNSYLYFLLDSEGRVCGLPDSVDNRFKISLGSTWDELWPKKRLSDGTKFTFNFEGEKWQVEVQEIKAENNLTTGYLALYNCLTDLKQNNKSDSINKLKNKIQFYETIINNSCDEIFVTDGHGKIILANPISENHYGLPIADLVGKNVWELEERGIYYPAITPMVLKAKKKITIDQETGIGKKLMLTATPVFDSKGNIEMVICNSRDVTALEDMKNNYHAIKNKVLQKQVSSSEHRPADTIENQLVYSANSPLTELMRVSQRVAKTESIVLLEGETGTGKDLFARHIHDLSDRKEGQYLKVNCAALPHELIESELFGYKAGAFTGASPKGKIGQFALADRGTIFLDEIAEIPMTLQPKLLQVIEEQRFIPIGSKSVEKVNVRIISSTNRDLKEMVGNGLFREDLYYRLCVLSVQIPPLRERKEDIPFLVDYYLAIFNKKYKRNIEMSREALDYLSEYNWPGNVRELKHLTERLSVTVTSSKIEPEHLPAHITGSQGSTGKPLNKKSFQANIEALERDLITKSYNKFKSSYKVAHDLGISQSSAIRKIRKYVK